MASIPVTIIGTMTYTDVGVGGGPMPGGPFPSHPIAPGGRPPGIWGGAPPYVDIGLPGPQPEPSHPIIIPPDSIAPGVPSHPIYLPPPSPEHPIIIPPDSLAPGVPSHPIVLPPGEPTHPIVIPPDSLAPGVPSHPIYLPPGIWGPTDPRPTPPIFLPPGQELPTSFTVIVKNNKTGEWKAMNFVPADATPPTPGGGPKE